MPPKEELYIVDYISAPEDDGGILFVSDKDTNQMSFEPLSEITLDITSKSMNHFSAMSLGRRVRGYFVIDESGMPSGEADFVTPLRADQTESF